MKVSTINIAKLWMQNYVGEGAICVDATAGRGNDTVFLSQLVGKNGKVHAFDIQKEAVDSTKQLLESKNLDASVYLDSHTNMDKYLEAESVDGIMFNFGYLPGADHTKCTNADSSIVAIDIACNLIKKNGVICLCVYHGGDTGFEEKDAILNHIKNLDYRKYTVALCDLYNKPNNPPLAVLIQKC